MMMRTLYLSSALAICGGVVVTAQSTDTVSPLLGFYEAGVLCAMEGGVMRDAPNTAAGSTLVVEDAPPFVSEGRLVPAVIGVGFGVRAGLQGALGQDNVVMTVTHPPLIGSGLTKQSFGTSIGGELTPGITFYQFDYPYELVLGDWTMTAKSNGVTFYQTTFTVVPPETLPDLAAICGYTELLS